MGRIRKLFEMPQKRLTASHSQPSEYHARVVYNDPSEPHNRRTERK